MAKTTLTFFIAISFSFNLLSDIDTKDQIKELSSITESIIKLKEKRDEARNKKDFTTADEIRNILYNMDIEIEDTKDGTKWRKK